MMKYSTIVESVFYLFNFIVGKAADDVSPGNSNYSIGMIN